MTHRPKSVLTAVPVFMLVVITLSLLLQEFYPFSRFPMYATFSPETYYVFLSDGEDQPVAVKRHFRYSVPKLKKMFNTRYRLLKQRRGTAGTDADLQREAAAGLLAFLLRDGRKDPEKTFAGLRLYRDRKSVV